MSVEIEAAIIGGPISGAVVLIGVLLAEYLVRRRERDQRLRAAALRLSLKVIEALEYAGPNPPNPSRWDYGSPGSFVLNEVNEALAEIDVLCCRRLGKKMVELRDQADELNAMFFAASVRVQRDGKTLNRDDIWTITAACYPIVETVFGKRQARDALVQKYVGHGFGG